MTPSSDIETPHCPHWCAERHGLVDGEDDLLHTGMVITVGEGLVAKLCMSLDPVSEVIDGPRVLVGGSDISLDEAWLLGRALIEMAEIASKDGHGPLPQAPRSALGGHRGA